MIAALVAAEFTTLGGHIITTGGVIVVAVVGAFGTYQAAKLQTIQRQTKPTGNGYAKRTEDSLERIDTRQVLILTWMDRLDQRITALDERMNGRDEQ